MAGKFFNEWDKLKSENRIFLYVILGLVVGIVMLSIATIFLVNSKTVVILPPKVDKEFYVVGDKLSTSYFEQVAFFLSDRMLSVSPHNAKASYDSIIPFLSDEKNEQIKIKASLDKQADLIIKENVFQVFYPGAIDLNEKEHTVTVNGSLRKYIGEMFIHDIEQKVIFHYQVKHGRLKIKEIEVK